MERLRLKSAHIVTSRKELSTLPKGKLLINTVNAHSYNVAQTDERFNEALQSHVLVPDGMSIVKACRWLKAVSQPTERISGWDLFCHEMEQLQAMVPSDGSATGGKRPKVMFLGSSTEVLNRIVERIKTDFPAFDIATFSPPYKPEFSQEDTRMMLEKINTEQPDLLWIGMTAPKQEKWAHEHIDEMNITCHVGTIGAVFDFLAGTVKRAPLWWQRHGLEWLYRLLAEPRRMWRRYLLGNPLFVYYMLREKLS